MKQTLGCVVLAGLMLAALGCPMMSMNGGGEEKMFSATLSGDQEVPAVVTAASGTGTFTLNTDQTELDFDVNAAGFPSAVVAAHFHNAAAGVNGDIVFDLGPFLTETDGQVTISGTTQLTDWTIDDPATELLNGNIYVNIHTEANPPGEIRGQVLTGADGAG